MTPDFKNDLVCHDQGECLRPTPETDKAWGSWPYAGPGVHANFARRLERQRNEALELLASEKATRNAIITKGIETERQLAEARQAFTIATDQLVRVQGELRQVREENARLREALDTLTLVIGLTPIAGNKEALQEAFDNARKLLTP